MVVALLVRIVADHQRCSLTSYCCVRTALRSLRAPLAWAALGLSYLACNLCASRHGKRGWGMSTNVSLEAATQPAIISTNSAFILVWKIDSRPRDLLVYSLIRNELPQTYESLTFFSNDVRIFPPGNAFLHGRTDVIFLIQARPSMTSVNFVIILIFFYYLFPLFISHFWVLK